MVHGSLPVRNTFQRNFRNNLTVSIHELWTMNYEPLAKTIRQKLNDLFPSSVDAIQFSPVGGGSINETCAIKFGKQQLFCKINSATKFPQLFEKERKGLEWLGRQNIIRVPQVIDCFETGKQQVLLLEWITEGERTESFWKNF